MSFHATKKLKFCYRVKLWFGSYCFLFWIFYQNRGLVQPNILSSQFARIKSREINSSYAEARIPLTNKKKNSLRTGRSVISSNKPVSHTRTWFPLRVTNYVANFENLKKYISNFFFVYIKFYLHICFRTADGLSFDAHSSISLSTYDTSCKKILLFHNFFKNSYRKAKYCIK